MKRLSIIRKELTMNTKDQIKNHLEYRGYEVNYTEEKNLICNKAGYASIYITVNDTCFRFWAAYNVNEIAKNNPSEFISYVNTLNQSNISATFTAEDTRIDFTAVSLGSYDKNLFSQFLDCWEMDTATMLNENSLTSRFLTNLDEVAQSDYDMNSSAYA